MVAKRRSTLLHCLHAASQCHIHTLSHFYCQACDKPLGARHTQLHDEIPQEGGFSLKDATAITAA